MFFFLDEKEPKNQAKTPNPFFIAQKILALAPEKLVFRAVLAKPTAQLLTYKKLKKSLTYMYLKLQDYTSLFKLTC